MQISEKRNSEAGSMPSSGNLAASPAMKQEDNASSSSLPSEMKEPNALPGVEVEGDIGNAQAGAGSFRGTEGAGTYSDSQ